MYGKQSEVVLSAERLEEAAWKQESIHEEEQSFIAACSRIPIHDFSMVVLTLRNVFRWGYLDVTSDDKLEHRKRFWMSSLWRWRKRSTTSMQGATKRQILPWLDILHGNGFVRERAIQAIRGGAPNSFFLGCVFLRSNDWVPQVRQAAEEKLAEVVEQTDETVIADVAWEFAPKMLLWGRIDAAKVSVYQRILYTPPVLKIVMERIENEAAGPTAQLLSQYLRDTSVDSYLHSLSRNSKQPGVRSAAYKALIGGRVFWLESYSHVWVDKAYCNKKRIPVLGERKLSIPIDKVEHMLAAASDPSVRVRKMLAQLLISERMPLNETTRFVAEKLSQDSHPIVSERAQWYLNDNASVVD